MEEELLADECYLFSMDSGFSLPKQMTMITDAFRWRARNELCAIEDESETAA